MGLNTRLAGVAFGTGALGLGAGLGAGLGLGLGFGLGFGVGFLSRRRPAQAMIAMSDLLHSGARLLEV
jgi:hypothetical protein